MNYDKWIINHSEPYGPVQYSYSYKLGQGNPKLDQLIIELGETEYVKRASAQLDWKNKRDVQIQLARIKNINTNMNTNMNTNTNKNINAYINANNGGDLAKQKAYKGTYRRNPKRSLRNPKRSLRNPKRPSRNPKRSLRNPKRSLRNPKRSLRNPKRSLRNQKRSLRN